MGGLKRQQQQQQPLQLQRRPRPVCGFLVPLLLLLLLLILLDCGQCLGAAAHSSSRPNRFPEEADEKVREGREGGTKTTTAASEEGIKHGN